ncbi:hypothetical protein C7293_17765 [filamentous cyanobacterium CCT1]|nr:hypothetical protein C7293_17765 [filamentous cyanobacterium CCT1]PSN79365.1 hypothetical protein C8B47_12035 [filamentous cyanobacterium CCP4]
MIGELHQRLRPNQWLSSLTMGAIAGVIDAMYAISFAALIFSGILDAHISTGVGLALVSVTITSVVIALTASLSGMLSTLQETSTAIMALIASSIASQMAPTASGNEILATVILTIVLTNLLTGFCYFAFGVLNLGNLPRFIPYPVVGGFLAGTGWLLVQGAMSLMTTLPPEVAQLGRLFQPAQLVQWLPGLGFAMLLLLLLRRYKHALIMPGALLGGTILFYLLLAATQTSIAEARTFGLFLDPFSAGELRPSFSIAELAQADWAVVVGQSGKMITIPLITVLVLLLKATGIELAIKQDLDLNQELRSAGIANVVSALAGGAMIGFQSLSLTTLSYRASVKSRTVGLFKALFCLVLLLIGGSIISYFPKPILGGMLLYLGLDYLVEWVVDAWFKLPKIDYAVVLLVLGVVSTIGFLEGVGFGLMVMIALFVFNYSQISAIKHIRSGTNYQSNIVRTSQQSRLLQQQGNQIYLLYLHGFLFFGTANKLLTPITKRIANQNISPLKFIVLNFRSVSGLDSSATLSFIKLRQLAEREELYLVFTDVSSTVQKQLRQGGCDIDEAPTCYSFSDLDRGIEWCENQILGAVPWRRRRFVPLAMQLGEQFSNEDHVAELMPYLEKISVSAGQVLFRPGDTPDYLYLIESGQVTLLLELEGAPSRRIQTLGPGRLFGELDFYLKSLYRSSAKADQPSQIYRLSRIAAEQMRQNSPEVAATFQELIIRLLSDRLACSYQEVTDLMQIT